MSRFPFTIWFTLHAAAAWQAAAPSSVELEARIQAAAGLQAEGRCVEAIPMLKTLATEQPKLAAAALLLGRCYFDQKDYASAEAPLRAAAAALPQSANPRFFLGSALGLAGHMPEAIEQLRIATTLDAAFAPAFRVLGMFRVEAGQYFPETRAALETAVRLDPEDGRAEYWLGRFHLGMKKYEAARPHLECALALAPESVQARLAYAQALSGLGDSARALGEFDAVLAREPASPAALLGRARCLYEAQQPAPALAAAEAARRGASDPEQEREALWILSRLYRALDRTADAEAAQRRLAEFESEDNRRQDRLRELQELALNYRAAHDTRKLASTLEEFVKLDPRQDLLTALGDAYMELGRVADAEQCFVRASEAGPESPDIAKRLRILRERYKESK